MRELRELRQALDQLDQQLMRLLNERMELAREVGVVKDFYKNPVTDIGREKAIITKIQKMADDPLLEENMEQIYTLIMESVKARRIFIPSSLSQDVGIVGWSPTGYSLAKALKLKFPSSHLLALADEGQEQLEAFSVDKVNLEDMVRRSDVIFLCSSFITMEWAQRIQTAAIHREKPLLVIDIASVKGEIVNLFERLTETPIEYVATYPLIDRQKATSAPHATLFFQKPWVIVPHLKNTPSALAQVQHFITALGGQAILIDAEQYAKTMALQVHLPAFLLESFKDFIEREGAEDNQLKNGAVALTKDIFLEEIDYNSELGQKYFEEWLHYLMQRYPWTTQKEGAA